MEMLMEGAQSRKQVEVQEEDRPVKGVSKASERVGGQEGPLGVVGLHLGQRTGERTGLDWSRLSAWGGRLRSSCLAPDGIQPGMGAWQE